jgi:hypothetical protein
MSALAQNKFAFVDFCDLRKKFTLKFLRPTYMYLADFMFHIVLAKLKRTAIKGG